MNFDKNKKTLNEKQKAEICRKCVKSSTHLSVVQNFANLECDDEIDLRLSQPHKEILSDSVRANEILKIALSIKNIKVLKYLADLGVKFGRLNEIGDKALQLSYYNKLDNLVKELFHIYQKENGLAIGDCGHMRIKITEDGRYSVAFMKMEDFDPISYNAIFSIRALSYLLKNVNNVNRPDSDGNTILHRICYDVRERCTAFDNTFRLWAMDLLIWHGADLNQTDSKKNTPVLCLFDSPLSVVYSAKDHTVVRQCQKDRLKIFIAAGAELDVSSDLRGNQTLLHAIVLSKARDVDFFTMESEVIFNDEIGAEMLEMLLLSETGGPDIDALNEEGRTALQEAVSYLNRDAVEVLLRHDADTSGIVFQGGYFEDKILLSPELIDNLNRIIELLCHNGFVLKHDDYKNILITIDTEKIHFLELGSLMSKCDPQAKDEINVSLRRKINNENNK